MGLIDRKIVQTRNYIDPNYPSPPDLNYDETFPITVFDAVRMDMNDESSETLTETINHLLELIQSKQPIFPGKPSNYIMTYAGVDGAIGAVQMTYDIPWDHESQRDDRIPTEKAVGDLVRKLGLVDEEGNLISPDRAKVRYSDIIGRPLIYDSLGDHTDGYIHQKGVTDQFRNVDEKFDEVKFWNNGLADELAKHKSNQNNPHCVSIDQIGAASAEVVNDHITNLDNPHHVTKYHVGLGYVDNTSDMDKPVSKATQDAIDEVKDLLNILQEDSNGFIVNVDYDQSSGILTASYSNKSFVKLLIPINGLIDEIYFNKETKMIDWYELSGEVKHTDLSDLFIRYVGSMSSSVEITIDGDQETGEQIIQAVIAPRGVCEENIADESIIERILANESVTTPKIRDLSVTTIKLADGSVSTEKVAVNAIINSKIGDRAVDGRTLFTSILDNRVLLVREHGTDPVFGQINSDMVGYKALATDNYGDGSITSEKVANKAITTPKLRDESVTTTKISNKNVTNIKIADNSIDERTIVSDIKLPGTPSIETRPADDSNGSAIPDTRWTMDRIKGYVNENHNYGDRSVDGRALFTSNVRHRVLTVLRANSDPVWGQVDGDMIAENSIDENHLVDSCVTRSKIADLQIYNNHLTDDSVGDRNLQTSAVTSPKIFTSNNANMVLAALKENGHPEYTKIVGDMLSPNSVTADKILDSSVTPSKIESSYEPNRLLAVTIKGTKPQWTRANTEMIEDSAVTLNKIKEVPFRDMVLGSQSAGTHPLWTKINGDMILDQVIKGRHISNKTINGDHLMDDSVTGKHIVHYEIGPEHIVPRSVTGDQLFTSEYPNRVLAITDPYSKAEWLQVETDMIENEAITREKIFQSRYPYRVIGTTQAGVPPEYILITNDFIMDDTIRPQKLTRDFVLYGTPTITLHPKPDSNGYDIADTKWVRDTVAETIKDFNPEILFDTIDTEMLKDHAVGPTKIFTSPYPGPRLLGVTAPGDDPEYLLVEEEMIVDGSITTNKIQRDLHLLGSPRVEVRPSPDAKESTGEGSLIPDVQWVLDRISEHSVGSGESGSTGDGNGNTGIPADNSVTTIKIQNRAVTGSKLFTSTAANKVLAVIQSNANPIYTTINANMMEDDSIEPRSIFKSIDDNRVMITRTAGTSPEWGKITLPMMSRDSVGTEQLVDECIIGDKIMNHTITRDKFQDTAFVDEDLLFDNSVSNSKIQNGAVDRDKLADEVIDSSKLDRDLVLKGIPTVESNTDYQTASIRNITISKDTPTGGNPGDIWIRYI